MKLKFITGLTLCVMFFSCGSEDTKKSEVKTPEKEEVQIEEIETISETTDPMSNKGIGPITSVTLGEIDNDLVEKGKEVYRANCTACHKMGKRLVGPALGGITERRSPEWIMNMILNPEEMVKKDPDAKALLEEYLAPMANQNLTEEEARAILELLRTKN